MAGELSDLEKAIETLVRNYEKYASRGFLWRKSGISKDGFQKMMSQELHHMLTNTENSKAVDQMRGSYDRNQDGVISFEEYWTLMGSIANTLLLTMEQPEKSPTD